jgi:hypothetical protein
MLPSGVEVVKEKKQILGARKFCWTAAASGNIGGEIRYSYVLEAGRLGRSSAAPVHDRG